MPNFSSSARSTFTTRIFSDVAGDITIVVDEESFLLHKFPLVSRSGKIRKMVADAKAYSNMELLNLPGGPHAFELAMKFCYDMNFEITAANVAALRCAAEFLEMTEEYREENLIARSEAYLNEVVVQSLEKSVQVLSTCKCLVKYLVCLVIDEAHRAQGNFSYCVAVRELMEVQPVPVQLRILALTATPGSKHKAIQDIIDNLKISTLEYRNESDLDVSPYVVHNRKLELIEVEMGKDADDITNMLLEVIHEY